MAQYSIAELFVVTYRHNDRGFDTGMPDEVFTTRDEADAAAALYNKSSKELSFSDGKDRYFVETLVSRLDTIRDECRSEGESMNQYRE